MSNKAEMMRLVNEALQELGLALRVFSIDAVQDKAHVWCINFFSDDGGPRFEITVAWVTNESVKEDLKQKLRAKTGN